MVLKSWPLKFRIVTPMKPINITLSYISIRTRSQVPVYLLYSYISKYCSDHVADHFCLLTVWLRWCISLTNNILKIDGILFLSSRMSIIHKQTTVLFTQVHFIGLYLAHIYGIFYVCHIQDAIYYTRCMPTLLNVPTESRHSHHFIGQVNMALASCRFHAGSGGRIYLQRNSCWKSKTQITWMFLSSFAI